MAHNVVSVIVPVFEDGQRAAEAIESILRQEMPPHMRLEILVVNDGSRPGTIKAIDSYRDHDSVRILDLQENLGRSAARNRGAHQATGKYLIFMDCDCLPLSERYIDTHVRALLSQGAVASCGDVVGPDRTFWSRYQEQASDRRKKAAGRGQGYVGTSQNLAVLRDVFLSCGGFNQLYRRYGFEDRDLLIRLLVAGAVFWTEAKVIHRDRLSTSSVLQKLKEAGTEGSSRFRAAHPQAYRELGYARFDVEDHPLTAQVASIIGSASIRHAHIIELLTNANWMPFLLSSSLVRICSAGAYALGTKNRPRI